jgi:tripartite ATP-independent transporter DctP family solute receptor
MKKVLIIVLCLAMILSLSACNSNKEVANGGETNEGVSSEPVVLKLSQSTPSNNPVSEGLTYFSEELDKISEGNVKVDVYFDAQLGSEPASIEGLNLGTIEMTRVATANMASFISELEVFNLPFLFRDNEHYWNVLNGEVGDFFKTKFEEKGFKLLTFYEDGSRNVYHHDKFIETAEDFKGVKIRTMTSAIIQKSFEAMGASPTPMNFGELYTALQQGVVNAGENNYSTIFTSKQYEVAPYITKTAHYRMPSVLIMSMTAWDKLTSEQQEYIQQAADSSQTWEIEHFKSVDEGYLEEAIKDGAKVAEFPVEEKAKLIEKLKPVYEECNETVGSDLVNKIINTK